MFQIQNSIKHHYLENDNLRNEYYLIPRGEKTPVPWNIYKSEQLKGLFNAAYLARAFQVMEKDLRISGLTFYMTFEQLDELPTYGQNVVVVIAGDEWYRIPRYIHRVGAVFKCVGTNPILGCNPFTTPTILSLLTLIQFLRILVVRIPGVVHYQFHKLKDLFLGTNTVAPILDIPLGYVNSKDLPIKKIEERLYDAYFSGSVAHVEYPIWSFKRWLGTPKMLSRSQMVVNVEELKKQRPDLKLETDLTNGFHTRTAQQEKTYSEIMMDTKICLVPRGTSFETTRLFEAMRYGSIVITEALPSRWYLEGAPIIQVNNWRQLQGVLQTLLDNPELMEELHQETLHWWEMRCSEAVIGNYFAAQLNAVRRASLLQPTLQMLAVQ
ncbi:hypothetical protein NIES4071_89180 [Calothrix sp. NIES-4071]|nr:hypothetical protein NIES4071_89180 [Calothrix sp. NIES-4071]BAZ63185.1 hypothetical protein NIES4105_89110 [Calothrix sp. NIES-4105]